jgi:hypothetical protein
VNSEAGKTGFTLAATSELRNIIGDCGSADDTISPVAAEFCGTDELESWATGGPPRNIEHRPREARHFLQCRDSESSLRASPTSQTPGVEENAGRLVSAEPLVAENRSSPDRFTRQFRCGLIFS